MALEIERANHFTKCATLGQDPGEMTPEEQQQFERIKQQVEALKAKGITPDLPAEL